MMIGECPGHHIHHIDPLAAGVKKPVKVAWAMPRKYFPRNVVDSLSTDGTFL